MPLGIIGLPLILNRFAFKRWPSFNSISSCGTLRFAPWKLTSFGFVFSILAFWTFISFHFGLLGLHFLSFWPFRPLFHVIFAFWACISFHFGFLGLYFLAFWLCGLHFLAFWPFRGQLLGPPPTSCQKWPVCPTSLQWIYQCQDRLHFAVFSLLGLYFLAF